MSGPWCILQMAAPRTLTVVRSLRAAGFEVWTPIRKRLQRRPRSNKYRDVTEALMPRFAFAPYEDAPRLTALLRAPVQDHPRFALLMSQDIYGKIADAELDAVRGFEVEAAEEHARQVEAQRLAEIERLRRRRGRQRGEGRTSNARAYVLGQTVRVKAPAFEGLTAKVVENRKNGEMVIVFENMSLQLTVEPCDLQPVHVGNGKPERAKAA